MKLLSFIFIQLFFLSFDEIIGQTDRGGRSRIRMTQDLNELPIKLEQDLNELPMRLEQDPNELPIRMEHVRNEPPTIMIQKPNEPQNVSLQKLFQDCYYSEERPFCRWDKLSEARTPNISKWEILCKDLSRRCVNADIVIQCSYMPYTEGPGKRYILLDEVKQDQRWFIVNMLRCDCWEPFKQRLTKKGFYVFPYNDSHYFKVEYVSSNPRNQLTITALLPLNFINYG